MWYDEQFTFCNQEMDPNEVPPEGACDSFAVKHCHLALLIPLVKAVQEGHVAKFVNSSVYKNAVLDQFTMAWSNHIDPAYIRRQYSGAQLMARFTQKYLGVELSSFDDVVRYVKGLQLVQTPPVRSERRALYDKFTILEGRVLHEDIICELAKHYRSNPSGWMRECAAIFQENVYLGFDASVYTLWFSEYLNEKVRFCEYVDELGVADLLQATLAEYDVANLKSFSTDSTI
jgi:hypothetical protein